MSSVATSTSSPPPTGTPVGAHRGGLDAPRGETGPAASDPVRDLAAVMARFRRIAALGAGRIGADVGLTPGQLAALLAIEDGAGGVSAVADQCLTHLSNASRTVDSLVRDELVDRSRDPDDGRAVVLAVTDRGHAALADLHHRRNDLMRGALGDLDATDQAHLVRLLTRLVEGLESTLHQPPD